MTTTEEKILKIIREMKFGEVIIKIKDGKPTTIEEKRTEKLD